MKSIIERQKQLSQKGFSLPELVIVLLILAILCVLVLPKLISSQRLFRFSAMQRQIGSELNEARQQAMSQRKPITFRYKNSTRQIIFYGGSFGALGAAENRVETLYGTGVGKSEVVYGRPSGVSSAALGDGTNITALSGGAVEVTFQMDGSVVDASGNPDNKALFFYDTNYDKNSAFAVSVLGAGGRVKVWRYNQGTNKYAE